MNSLKYPRTPHLPWSEGPSDDDRRLSNVDHFIGREVVVTEKLDGECSTLTSERVYPRSPDARFHPSQSKVRALHAQIRQHIPSGWRIIVENCAALHTFGYDDLESLFPVIAVFDDISGQSLSWTDTDSIASELGLPTAPVLWRGLWDEAAIRGCYRGEWPSPTGGVHRQEGYVVRVSSMFALDMSLPSEEIMSSFVAKFVSSRFKAALDESVRLAKLDGANGHWRAKPVVWNSRRPNSAWVG